MRAPRTSMSRWQDPRWRRGALWTTNWVVAAVLIALLFIRLSASADLARAAATSHEAPTSAEPSAAPDAEIASPDRASPDRASPGRASPGRASPGRASPGRASPGRTETESASPDRTEIESAARDASGSPGPSLDDAFSVRARALEARVEACIAEAVQKARELAGPKFDGDEVVVAVHVQGLEDPRPLISRLAGRNLRPASNLKVLTTSAALLLLGADGEFVTPVEANGPIASGVLAGDLVLRAGGDPLYRDEGDGSIGPWLDELASQLAAHDVRSVEGQLLLDEGTFADPQPGPAWPSSNEYWKEYCALAGGFSANAGCLTATVFATSPGELARVQLEPRGHGLRRRGELRTGAKRSRLNVAVGANASGVTVRGSLPADVPRWTTRFAAPDPVALFGAAAVAGLAERGVAIAGGFGRARDVPSGTRLGSITSPILSVIEPILKDSNNSVSDQLFLATGLQVVGQGTRAAGAQAVARALERLSIPTDGWSQVDGSGLSRDNRVSARQLCGLLREVLRTAPELAKRIEQAMPVAGESGTLKKRMRDSVARGRVHAKTGFINGTSGLSGWADTESGERLVFSILVAYPTFDGLNTRCWKPMQDRICEALVDDLP